MPNTTETTACTDTPISDTPDDPRTPHGGNPDPVTTATADDSILESDDASEEALPETLPEIHAEALPETDLSFAALGLSEAILKCVEKVGFKHPTPIQSALIPIALTGRDVVGLAQTGSGKTAAFVLPLAERLTHGKGLRGLILCPTREIALQTKAFLDLFGKDHHLKTACLIGGMRMGGQIQDLKNRPDIIVATPGRLFDHMERKNVDLRGITELVLDEADHMLDMGFLPQILRILRVLPKERHTMMFSATMPDSINDLTKRFLKDPERIDITPPGKAAHGITHRLYLVDWKNKEDCLMALLNETKGLTLVFTRMKSDADWITRFLQSRNFDVTVIHSDLRQSKRISALSDFRTGKRNVLIATDIASRGIDVPEIMHVINFDVPENAEDYIHRAGRTARAELEGVVSTIATALDRAMIKKIEDMLEQEFPRCTAPGITPYEEYKPKPQLSSRYVSRRRR